ncbi:unnamed protein product [Tilletia controversa]|uniref:Uncharacterized protein n=2 Tax=Tilletia TaxID=13289 RepID=A0A9N8LLT8_9BASI|nr:hypothetical protein CF336_g52 [Tilletia laevis]KAE8206220.1 hypothetical protein CF328_g38 [Tilletia controversa]CAD6890690.1 unnamed protein product [Tilletia caries]KAE8208482.1 hypothetical protein CF335_g385 [Tilletia laevis]CAD6896894.1 unnamed protein product [Tilletia controversa]
MADEKINTDENVQVNDANDTNASDKSRHEERQQNKGGLSHVGMIFACGAALFSDGYVNAISGPVGSILKRLYQAEDEKRFIHFKKLFSSLGFAGTVIGMLVFGYLTDRVGRKFGMLFASIWLSIFCILSALAWGAGGSIDGLFSALIAFRFIQGIAIGAEYPAGSVACSESTESAGVNKKRQQMYFSLATHTMLDLGFLVAHFVPLVLVWIFGMNHLKVVWRLSLGLGAVPPLSLLYARAKMQEPIHYRKSSIRFAQMPWWLIVKRYWLRLAAVSIAWFIYDWISYPASVFADYIIIQVLPTDASFQANLGWGVVINLFNLPGSLVGALVNDRLGPKYTMILGLIVQAVIGFSLAGGYALLKAHIGAFVVLYGLFLSAGEFGPGNNLGMYVDAVYIF